MSSLGSSHGSGGRAGSCVPLAIIGANTEELAPQRRCWPPDPGTGVSKSSGSSATPTPAIRRAIRWPCLGPGDGHRRDPGRTGDRWRDHRRHRHRPRHVEPAHPPPDRRGVHVELSSTLPRHRLAAARRSGPSAASRWSTSSPSSATAGARPPSARSTSCWPSAPSSLTLPIVLVAMAAIRLDSKGPVLFRQVRVGRNGRPFQVLKLRTMVLDAEARLDELLADNEADGPAVQDDERPPGHPGRPLPAQDLDRRAAAAVERGAGRDEPGRAPPRPPRRDRGLGPAA